jgi:hypothetical protein
VGAGIAIMLDPTKTVLGAEYPYTSRERTVTRWFDTNLFVQVRLVQALGTAPWQQRWTQIDRDGLVMRLKTSVVAHYLYTSRERTVTRWFDTNLFVQVRLVSSFGYGIQAPALERLVLLWAFQGSSGSCAADVLRVTGDRAHTIEG